MLGSKNIGPIPPLPTVEGKELVERLEKALSGMHRTQTSGSVPVKQETTESTNNTSTNPASDDVDVVDVATRVAMAVEFLSEWSLYPENEVFQRIYAGITDPELIGDKAKWFSKSLPQIHFPVWSKSTGALLELVLCWAAQIHSNADDSTASGGTNGTRPSLPAFDYTQYRTQRLDFSNAFCPPKNSDDQLRGAIKSRASVRRRKKTRPSDLIGDVDRNSGQYGSVPDDRALASQFTFDQSNSNWDSSADSSSELSDVDIWDLAGNKEGESAAVHEDSNVPVDKELGIGDLLMRTLAITEAICIKYSTHELLTQKRFIQALHLPWVREPTPPPQPL
ncbi:unnamed protein product [Echinostoma caproni]|uniref:Rab3 GTPase-activating protein catalytic subunit n=1 Tax=Echinostoma caproni TaxID=27848 RepID=A0A183ABP0_9TREM|nr:unnamed protein product [Echinostoma caproni]